MADKLEIYKGALALLGNAAGLSSLTEANAARYRLDDIWAPSVNYLLRKGLWNFGIRSVEVSNDEDFEQLFGYQYKYTKPTDWVRTVNISDSGYFNNDFNDYTDEAGVWYANVDPIYVRYVSDGVSYGWNIGAWGPAFAQTVEAYLAYKSGLSISNDKGNRNDLHGLYKGLLREAKMLDAVDEAVQYRPPGRLTRSRFTRSNRMDG